MAEKLRIGIVGDGNVGTALTQGLTRAGHEVRAVGKEPERVHELASWAEAIVLAVPFGERENAVREMNGAYSGKLLVDVTNALLPQGAFAGSVERSGAEELQSMARDARVVKAFNTVFAQNMSEGRVHGEKLTAFVAGDDAGAKRKATTIGEALGFDVVDAGPLKNARWLEALGYLNIQLGYGQNLGPAIGFRLVHEGNVAAAKSPEGVARKR